MYARALYQFHNAGHEHIFAVAYRVHLYLLAHDVLIHQYGLIGIHLHSGF